MRINGAKIAVSVHAYYTTLLTKNQVDQNAAENFHITVFVKYKTFVRFYPRLCHLLHKYQHEKIKNLRKIWDFLLTNSI